MHVGIEVALPVPAELGDLGHGVDVAQDIFPVGLDVARLGHEARHTHDGHVRRFGALHPAAALVGEGSVFETIDPVRSIDRHLGVQVLDGTHLVVERRRLSEHVGALGVLVARSDSHVGCVVVAGSGLGPALESLGRDAQAVEDQGFELFLNLGRRPSRLGEPLPVFHDRLGERRVGAAHRVAGRCLHELGPRAVENLLLVGLHDRLGLDSVLGEEVGRSHEHADLDPPLGEGRGDGGGHRRREAVVDPTAEEHMIVGRVVGRDLLEEHIDRHGPEFETRARTHASAALAALEDESFRSPGQQGGEGVSRVRVNVDARLRADRVGHREYFVVCVARDHAEGGADGAHRFDLLRRQFSRKRAEESHTPGTIVEQPAPLGKKFRQLSTARVAQSQEGQRALFGDPKAECGLVADPDHRGLDDRKRRAMGHGQGCGRVERPRGPGGVDCGIDRLAESLESPAHGEIFVSQTGSHGCIGAEGNDLRDRIIPSHDRVDFFAPRSALLRARPGAAQDHLLFVAQGVDHGASGPVQDPEGRAELLADADRVKAAPGLPAAPGGHDLLRRAGQSRLALQGELIIEHRSHGAGSEAGRGRVRSHAALGPDGEGKVVQEALHQDEGRFLTHPSGSLIALGDQPVGLGADAEAGLFETRRLEQNGQAVAVQCLDERSEDLGVGRGEDHDLDRIGQAGAFGQLRQGRVEVGASAVELDTAFSPGECGELVDRGHGSRRGRGIVPGEVFEVEDTERARAAGRDGDRGIGLTGRRQCNESKGTHNALSFKRL